MLLATTSGNRGRRDPLIFPADDFSEGRQTNVSGGTDRVHADYFH